MAKKLTTFEKLRRSFENIGVSLDDLDGNGIVEFDYDYGEYELKVIEEAENFYLSMYIGLLDIEVPKCVFESALDMTKYIYKDISGEWDDGYGWISSPNYSLKGRRILPKTILRGLLNDIFEAYTSMECNVLMMMEESIFDDIPPDNLDLE